MQTLYQIALITHIVGITLMAGATLVEYLLTKHLYKLHVSDRSRAITTNEDGFNLHSLITIGIILLILSGGTMFLITQGFFGKQIWFQIKIGLIIIIAINGSVFGKRQDLKFKSLLSEKLNFHQDYSLGQENRKEDLMKVKNNLDFFYISQLCMFLIIFTLSVFKFN